MTKKEEEKHSEPCYGVACSSRRVTRAKNESCNRMSEDSAAWLQSKKVASAALYCRREQRVFSSRGRDAGTLWRSHWPRWRSGEALWRCCGLPLKISRQHSPGMPRHHLAGAELVLRPNQRRCPATSAVVTGLMITAAWLTVTHQNEDNSRIVSNFSRGCNTAEFGLGEDYTSQNAPFRLWCDCEAEVARL